MSYIKNIDIIYNEMQRQSIRYWQIFDQNKSDIIAESIEDENLTITDSIEHLREITNTLEGLVYIIIRKDSAAAKRKATATDNTAGMDKYKGIYKFQVLLGEGKAANNSNSFSGGGGNVMNMYLTGVKENFDLQIKHMQEKAELEKSFEERMKKLEEKLDKRSHKDESLLSDEYAKRGLELLDKFLSREQKK